MSSTTTTTTATTTKAWHVVGKSKADFSALKFQDDPIPELGDNDVLVKFHSASLNYRDLIIVKGSYPFPQTDNVVPGSDGAGTILSVGKRVSRFQPGDKVVTLFNQGHIYGSLDATTMSTGVGGAVDGTLRQHGVFPEHGLVAMPSNLSFREASTLSCAGLTAWNALFGAQRVMPGDWVLTQGTGGVSVFAVQFAKAAGARVIATTSSAAKGEKLKELGADHVLNYKDDAEWGTTALKLTGNAAGVKHVVEVGGPNTMKQSLKAVAVDGTISIIGFLGGAKGEGHPTFLDVLLNTCNVRGVVVGSRMQFEEMNRAVEANDIKPIVDEKAWKLEELAEAYQYMWEQKHFAKVCIDIE